MSRCACEWITGAGRTCRSTSASENGCRNPARKSPSISKRRRRCCSTASRKSLDQNVLVIRIQPDEGISLRMQAKVPGTSFRIEPVKMDFHYGTSFGKASPEAYERLLLDAMSGRRDALRPARRSGAGLGVHRHDRGSVGGEGGRAETVRLIRPARGDRRKRMNCWRATGAPGGGYDASGSRNATGSRNDLISHAGDRSFHRRTAGRDRPDRSRTEEALGCERRRDDPRVAHQSRGLQRSAGLVRQKHRDHFADHGKPRLPRDRHRG